MNNELPSIKIPPCHCGQESVLNIRKIRKRGETIYKISCRVHGGGKWADTIDKALVVWSAYNESE